jgi:hypothetical protein
VTAEPRPVVVAQGAQTGIAQLADREHAQFQRAPPSGMRSASIHSPSRS